MTTDVLKVTGDYLLDARNGDFTVNLSNSVHTGTMTVVGNLNVIGQTTQIETVDSRIKDNILVLNSGETNDYVTLGTSGLLIARGNSDQIPNAATLFYNDDSVWTVDPSEPSVRGVFEFKSAQAGSAISVNAIRIDTASTSSLSILGADNPNSVISVIGTVDYETRVVHDDHIPNKKYVDQAIYLGTDIARRLQVGDSFLQIVDDSVDFSDPFYGPSSKIWAALNTSSNVVFRLEGSEAQIQGLTINDNILQVNTSTSDLVLQPQTGQAVKVSSALKLQKITTTPSPELNHDTLYYNGTPGGGGTGLYYVNNSSTDELVSRKRAIIYGIIF
jgi:hypothetical protein